MTATTTEKAPKANKPAKDSAAESPEKDKTPKPGQLLFVKPEVVKQGRNPRWEDQTDEGEAEEMAKSFHRDGGQLQPIRVAVGTDKSLTCVDGRRRLAGALYYNKKYPNKQMLIQCVVTVVNDEDAFVQGIIANYERKETTAVDDAFNHKTLREEFGWTDASIAKRYNIQPAMVSRLKKLLVLPKDILTMIHKGDITRDVGFDLADLGPETQKRFLAEMKKIDEEAEEKRDALEAQFNAEDDADDEGDDEPAKDGEPKAKKPKDAKEPLSGLQKKAAEDAKRGAKPKAKDSKKKKQAVAKKVVAEEKKKGGKTPTPLTLVQVKEYFQDLTDLVGTDKPIKTLAESMLKFIAGQISPDLMTKALASFVKDETA